MIKKPIKFSGVGIHSGVVANVVIRPARAKGIFFKRVDLHDAELIPALWNHVQNTGLLSTSIGKAPNQVQTIEHFMAALFLCGIDSAIVEIDGPEFPILDGGAQQFIELISKNVDTKAKNKIKKIVVKKEIIATRQEIIKQMPVINRFALWIHGLKTGRKEDGFVKLSPESCGFLMDITLDYPDAVIGKQKFEFIFDMSASSKLKFKKHIAKCRTFGRLWEWEYLKKRGMGRGATPENVIVLMNGYEDWDKLKQSGYNEKDLKKLLKNHGAQTLTPLYYPDEFVRHKLIDALGDFYTSGGMIVGKLESYKGSHGLNNLILKKLFSDPANYDIID